jgi:hypothetical protein
MPQFKEKLVITDHKRFSFVLHLFNPIIASLITFFFLWILQDFLLLNFLYEDGLVTLIGFITLTIVMITISWFLPQNSIETK